MLVQSRFLELDGSRRLAHLPGMDPPPFLSADEARAAADWEWNLLAVSTSTCKTVIPMCSSL